MKVIYTKEACPACVALKASLAQAGEPFLEVRIGVDISREDFIVANPGIRSVPYVKEIDDAYGMGLD